MSEFDAYDLDKSVVYLPRHSTRTFASADNLRRWVLSLLERGHYLRGLRLSRGAQVIEAVGTLAPAAPDLVPVRARGGARVGAGRPPKGARKTTTAKEKRKKHAEAQKRYAAKKNKEKKR
jgi:hypothetical protein